MIKSIVELILKKARIKSSIRIDSDTIEFRIHNVLMQCTIINSKIKIIILVTGAIAKESMANGLRSGFEISLDDPQSITKAAQFVKTWARWENWLLSERRI